jgi:DNA-binding response OmpR family regulator
MQNNIGTQTEALPTMGTDLDSVMDISRKKVLVIDDDPDFVKMTKMILSQAGYDVAGATDCNSALEKCSNIKPDVILLDLMMPQIDGFETYRRLSLITKAPVIIVSAIGDPEQAVKSFQIGIEDYIPKPFYSAEMVARVQAVLRRTKPGTNENTMVFPKVDLVIKLDTLEVFQRGKFTRLVPREFTVLEILARNAPRPVMYSAITEKIWGEDSVKTRAHLKNIIFGLRVKLEQNPEDPTLLINNRSMGYQLLTNSD